MKKAQKGASLVVAIFIVVIMSLLAAALINITSSGTETVAREVVSARALMAAESGAQRLLNEISNGSELNCAAAATQPGKIVNQTHPFTFSALEGCGTVNVFCEFRQVQVGGDIYYTLTSTGTCGPTGDEAVRIIELQAKNI